MVQRENGSGANRAIRRIDENLLRGAAELGKRKTKYKTHNPSREDIDVLNKFINSECSVTCGASVYKHELFVAYTAYCSRLNPIYSNALGKIKFYEQLNKMVSVEVFRENPYEPRRFGGITITKKHNEKVGTI